MARQSTTTVRYDRTLRRDNNNTKTSARAGVVVPIGYAPLLRGDSAAGRISVDLLLKEMPKPLQNAVIARFQAWFVPRSSLPYFSGRDEFMHSYQGEDVKALGVADRTPPAFFDTETGTTEIATLAASELYTTMGIHLTPATPVNLDLVDAFNLVYNFRLKSYTSKLARRDYYSEDAAASVTLPPAFWPMSRMAAVVPDYEQALVTGALDLDIATGKVPVSGFGKENQTFDFSNQAVYETGGSGTTQYVGAAKIEGSANRSHFAEEDPNNSGFIGLFAEMAGETLVTSLADIDKARTTQAMAKLRSAYAGTDASGFDNDDVIISELMQGFNVPDDLFSRPWLLDSKNAVFGITERHAMDGANLDDSISIGRAGVTLSVNVPANDVGGIIIYTVEVMPELLTERASDEFQTKILPADLPNALRDIQRTEPVDNVLSRRIDTAHTTPLALYGYEPMNAEWQREFTRLGGEYLQTTPGTPITTARSALWQVDIVDPVFADDHYLCPVPFPHDVFSDTAADAFDIVARHDLTIAGITQFGDVLVEDNDDFQEVAAEQV